MAGTMLVNEIEKKITNFCILHPGPGFLFWEGGKITIFLGYFFAM